MFVSTSLWKTKIHFQGLDDFCRAHPRIEHLLINDNNGLPFRLKDDWKLEKLKTLVYSCSFPKQGIEDNLHFDP